MRSHWKEISLDYHDFLEARVEAMSAHIAKLEQTINLQKKEIEILEGFYADTNNNEPTTDYPVPSMLFSAMSVQNQAGVIWS